MKTERGAEIEKPRGRRLNVHDEERSKEGRDREEVFAFVEF